MWRGTPVDGYYDTRYLTGICSAQARVEGVVLKDTWHLDSNSGIAYDPPGEPDCTPLYVDLPSAWGSVEGDCIFPHISWDSTLIVDSERYEWQIKQWIWKRSNSLHTCSIGGYMKWWGERGGALLPRTLKDR